MNTKMGVVIYVYLKNSPDYDSKCILVHGSIFLGSSVFRKVPFLAFLAFIQGKEEVWPGEIQPMLLPELSCIYIPVLDL